MALTMYDQTVPVLARMLGNLSSLLQKLGEHAAAKKYDPKVLLNSRLYPDMYDLTRQVQITTDTAKGAVARLAGVDLPSWPDTETTLEEVQARVRKAIDFVSSFQPGQFVGSENRTVEMKFPNATFSFSGSDYLSGFALPNFYFHYTTAYNILRHNGIEVGKRDFLGETPRK